MNTNDRNSVTSQLYRAGEVDEAKYAAFVAKTVRSNLRARDKANAKGDPRGLWYGFTDEQCREAAEAYCHCYRHQKRVTRRAERRMGRAEIADRLDEMGDEHEPCGMSLLVWFAVGDYATGEGFVTWAWDDEAFPADEYTWTYQSVTGGHGTVLYEGYDHTRAVKALADFQARYREPAPTDFHELLARI